MKVGVVLGSNDAETAWNAFRFSLAALKKGHLVKVFLISKGVEAPDVASEKFNVREKLDLFVKQGGTLLACGTCLESRKKEGVCPVSSMAELLALVEESDKVLTF